MFSVQNQCMQLFALKKSVVKMKDMGAKFCALTVVTKNEVMLIFYIKIVTLINFLNFSFNR